VPLHEGILVPLLGGFRLRKPAPCSHMRRVPSSFAQFPWRLQRGVRALTSEVFRDFGSLGTQRWVWRHVKDFGSPGRLPKSFPAGGPDRSSCPGCGATRGRSRSPVVTEGLKVREGPLAASCPSDPDSGAVRATRGTRGRLPKSSGTSEVLGRGKRLAACQRLRKFRKTSEVRDRRRRRRRGPQRRANSRVRGGRRGGPRPLSGGRRGRRRG